MYTIPTKHYYYYYYSKLLIKIPTKQYLEHLCST